MEIKQVLMGDRLLEGRHHDVVGIRELTEDDSIHLEFAIGLLSQFSRSYGLYEICYKNYMEILGIFDEISKLQGLGQDTARNYGIEMNRGLLNFLCSFRAYIDHTERSLKNWDSVEKDYLTLFHDRTSYHYDNDFYYRFLWKLRNYIQHRGLPFAGIEKELVAGDSGEVTPRTLVYFNRDFLLQDYNDWGVVKEDLIGKQEKIDVMTCVNGLMSCIDDLGLVVAEMNLDRLDDGAEFLGGLANEVIGQYPDAIPIIGNIRLRNDRTLEIISLDSLPLDTLNAIEELKKRLGRTDTSFSDEIANQGETN